MITKEQQKKIISRNVRKALHELNMALKEHDAYVDSHQLADVAGCAHSTVDRIIEAESMPGAWTISRLAKALYCKPGDLLPSLVELNTTRGQSCYAHKKSSSERKRRGKKPDLKVVAS